MEATLLPTYSPPPSPVTIDSVWKRFKLENPTDVSRSGTPASVDNPFSNEKVDSHAKAVFDAFMTKVESNTTSPYEGESFESMLWMSMVVNADGTAAALAKDPANTQLLPGTHLDPFLAATEALLRRYPPSSQVTDLFAETAGGIDNSAFAQKMCNWARGKSTDPGFDVVIDSLRWYFVTAPPALDELRDSEQEARTAGSGLLTSEEADKKANLEMGIKFRGANSIRARIYGGVKRIYKSVFMEASKSRQPTTSNALQPSS